MACTSQKDPKTAGDTSNTPNGKWTEDSIQTACEPPYRVCVRKQNANNPSISQLKTILKNSIFNVSISEWPPGCLSKNIISRRVQS